VNRFSANASKAKQAGARQKLIEKLKSQQIEVKPSSRVSPYIRFKVGKPLGKDVINAKNISKSYGNLKVFENVSLTINKGENLPSSELMELVRLPSSNVL